MVACRLSWSLGGRLTAPWELTGERNASPVERRLGRPFERGERVSRRREAARDRGFPPFCFWCRVVGSCSVPCGTGQRDSGKPVAVVEKRNQLPAAVARRAAAGVVETESVNIDVVVL